MKADEVRLYALRGGLKKQAVCYTHFHSNKVFRGDLIFRKGNDMEIKNKKLAALWQFVKFGMVGAFNTVLNYIIYNFCYYVFHSGAQVANLVGFVISVLSAFLLQSKFVFRQDENAEKRVWWKVLIKTYISYSITGLFLTALLLFNEHYINILSLAVCALTIFSGVQYFWELRDLFREDFGK